MEQQIEKGGGGKTGGKWKQAAWKPWGKQGENRGEGPWGQGGGDRGKGREDLTITHS